MIYDNIYVKESRHWKNRGETTNFNTEREVVFTDTIENGYTSKYYTINIPENAVKAIEVEITFNGENGAAEYYRQQLNGFNVVYPSTNEKSAKFADSTLGKFVTESVIVVSNLNYESDLSYTIRVNPILQ